MSCGEQDQEDTCDLYCKVDVYRISESDTTLMNNYEAIFCSDIDPLSQETLLNDSLLVVRFCEYER